MDKRKLFARIMAGLLVLAMILGFLPMFAG